MAAKFSRRLRRGSAHGSISGPKLASRKNSRPTTSFPRVPAKQSDSEEALPLGHTPPPVVSGDSKSETQVGGYPSQIPSCYKLLVNAFRTNLTGANRGNREGNRIFCSLCFLLFNFLFH